MPNTEPLFDWLDTRAAGVLLHPTSLPGSQGIGKFGREARRFVDFLEASGMSLWQVCPLGPTGYGDSPYQCFSAFAGNPYLIDLEPLLGCGLVTNEEIASLERLPTDSVDFGGIYEHLWPILNAVCSRYSENPTALSGFGDYKAFKATHEEWLQPYAAFSAAKKHFGGKPWNSWPKKYRSYQFFQKSDLPKKLTQEMESVCFIQFLFFEQWNALREYAKSKGVSIIGDAPIFVAYDSADVWAYPEFFQLKSDGSPSAVAGCPPDYFAPTGQLWGNPLYNWEAMAADDYKWWKKRLHANFELYDIIRLDHFRGFASYWSIPADAPDARPGKWTPGPGLDFFKALKDEFGNAKLIAEDLGDITPDVIELLKETGLPGMAVLQFGFGSESTSIHFPHNNHPNLAVYPGSHDNNTTLGWYKDLSQALKDLFRRYFGVDGSAPQWDLTRAAYKSPGRLAIIPLQDLLNLDSEARMNLPGEAAGNWQWRYRAEQLDQLWCESAAYLKELGELYGRTETN
ncbi:4-alpha-glucanotransferase [Rubellicoccus peritrichatus]|uniref:4-alpha-glucanotransferase n=1 Tax=Rubellicoccus peritrichatus TaxID=3080537 RepID=A0AAQ3LCT8_9BACT|nr:4-alpha-glucanotransferase [Puniceicoccus sp. CR14]WOO39589.1 4-alpha-glucanotransferase [Puniceicoccus sp. CR14]